jgi:hypothetical protein
LRIGYSGQAPDIEEFEEALHALSDALLPARPPTPESVTPEDI